MTRYAEDGSGLLAVALKNSGEVIGDCGAVWQEVEGRRELEIGYHIARNRWRLGYATEAARVVMRYAFRRFPVEHVISLIRPENLPSRRVAEKNGMKIDREIEWKGIRHFVYAIDRSDFRT